MLSTPQPPALQGPDLLSVLADMPLRIAPSPLVLAVSLALVGIFFAAVSVVLVYHWHRFPFDRSTLVRVERIYWAGAVLLVITAFVGILSA